MGYNLMCPIQFQFLMVSWTFLTTHYTYTTKLKSNGVKVSPCFRSF
jgi:hypothetical protein